MPRFASVTDRLTLTFGARYTEDERFGGKLTPRAYATYAITDSLTSACGISTGYKTSELRESAANYYSCTGGSCRRAVALGNPNLKPEQCTSYELGLRFDIRITTAGNVACQTDFRNRIDSQDTEQQFQGGRTDLYEWDNIGKAKAEGVELNARHAFSDRFRIGGSYTYTKSKQQTGDLQGDPLRPAPEAPSQPAHGLADRSGLT